MKNKTHFPPNIELPNKPLVEAWLEIRWQLTSDENQPALKIDPGFAFNLGAFLTSVKEDYPHLVELDTLKIPAEFTPYKPRYQFRKTEDGFPLIHFGPGVVSVNFTDSYNWQIFKSACEYLRKTITNVYSETNLKIDIIILRYKNSIPFQYTKSNIFTYMKDKLNSSIEFPEFIPGFAGKSKNPTKFEIQTSFDLSYPKGTGTLSFATGLEKQKNKEIILNQIEIASGGIDSPSLYDETAFSLWLENAHEVAHEWFFSIIDGDLRKTFLGLNNVDIT